MVKNTFYTFIGYYEQDSSSTSDSQGPIKITAKENTLEAITSISVVLEETSAAVTDVLAAVNEQEATTEQFNLEVERLRENSQKLQSSIGMFKI